MITWKCHICGKERPDDKISVYKVDLGVEQGLPPGVMSMNVRYCNDNPDCIAKAPKFRLGGPKGGT